MIEALMRQVNELQRRIEDLETQEAVIFIPLTTPLTSTSWDGDARSTTAATLIDLSAVFSAPANIKAALVTLDVRDSGSAGGDYYIGLAPNNGGTFPATLRVSGLPNDSIHTEQFVCSCDSNGDVYFTIAASGAGTMDVWLRIWGYWI